MNKPFKYYTSSGRERTVLLPCKAHVCSNCGGTGFTLRESMRYHAYSREEFEDSFHDEEDRAEYFKRGGIYDQICSVCSGDNVVWLPSVKLMTEEQKKLWARVRREEREKEEYDRICRAERAMGA